MKDGFMRVWVLISVAALAVASCDSSVLQDPDDEIEPPAESELGRVYYEVNYSDSVHVGYVSLDDPTDRGILYRGNPRLEKPSSVGDTGSLVAKASHDTVVLLDKEHSDIDTLFSGQSFPSVLRPMQLLDTRNQLAFAQGAGITFIPTVITLDLGTRTWEVQTTESRFLSSWSQDTVLVSSRVAVDDSRDILKLLDLQSGSLKELPNPKFDVRNPIHFVSNTFDTAVRNEETGLIVVGYRDSRWRIAVTNRDGSVFIPGPTLSGNEWSPHWGPDGKVLFMHATVRTDRRGDDTAILLWDWENGKTEELIDSGQFEGGPFLDFPSY